MKSLDDQVVRLPVDAPRVRKVGEVLPHGVGDVEAARIVVPAQQQHALPTFGLVPFESPHT
jgi:hypothetical protein